MAIMREFKSTNLRYDITEVVNFLRLVDIVVRLPETDPRAEEFSRLLDSDLRDINEDA